MSGDPTGRGRGRPKKAQEEIVGWKPDARCPRCGRCTNVRFGEGEVQRAKLDRQRAHVLEVTCGRQECRTRYWIHAGDIARSRQVREKVDAKRSSA